MSGVGHAYAVLAGRRTGDKEKARMFLGSMFREEIRARNSHESRSRGKPRKPYKPGQKVK
jgi:hypothetical protein